MNKLRLSTRITIWSALVVTLGIVLCGAVSTFYVLHNERNELDQQLRDEAKHFLGEWKSHANSNFNWSQNAKEVESWVVPSTPPRIVTVQDAQGRSLYQSKSLSSDFIASLPLGFHSVSAGDTEWRVGVFEKNGIRLRLGADLEPVNDLGEELATTFLLSLPIVLAIVGLGSRWIAYKALIPVQEITAVAEQITAQDLGRRIPLPPARDEIHRLGTVLNATFDRLQQSFLQATRFSADASHELKTPLTVLRASIETMLRASEHDLEAQQNLVGLLDETKRLSAITESLLLLSRADAGKLELDLHSGDLAETILLCAEDAAILFETERISVELKVTEQAPAMFDRTRLSQILLNLLDNAGKYNRPNGRILISLSGTQTTWRIAVANTGPGIPTEIAARLFTRFFRGEHSSEKAGHGLGLSLSRELARAHHGDLVLESSVDGWTIFALILPKLISDTHCAAVP
jgi:signal transduction histidine kinase